jgi:hypothetical protein
MTEKYEETRIHSHGDHQHRERIVVDESAESRRMAYRISSIIWVFFGLLIGLLSLRILLKLIGANADAPFAELVYGFSEIFLWPFFGLIGSPAVDGMVLEIPTVIAIIVYALIGWAIVKLTALLIYRP